MKKKLCSSQNSSASASQANPNVCPVCLFDQLASPLSGLLSAMFLYLPLLFLLNLYLENPYLVC